MSPPGDDDPRQPSDSSRTSDSERSGERDRSGDANGPADSGDSPGGASGPLDGTDERAGGDAERTGSGRRGERPNGGHLREERERASEAEEGTDWFLVLTDVASSVLAVTLVGLFLFAVSGVWPPMVAVESPSMHPNMQTGDLVFVMDAERFPGEGAHADTGVVTAQAGADTGYLQFQQPGDVIVFAPDGSGDRTPIIHRAVFWVEDGENWYARADPDDRGNADGCEEMRNCPAPHAGFVTKGDNNPTYDQVTGLSEPVRPEWVVGTAEARIPGLGWIRLRSGGARGHATDTGAPEVDRPPANQSSSGGIATGSTPAGPVPA